jgi:hypothetical protein
LSTDLASDNLDNALIDLYVEGTTSTGLDQLVNIITNEAGLISRITNSEIKTGALAADGMNHIIVQAILATGAADEASIDTTELVDINAYIRANHLIEWTNLHGDDEEFSDTGFHSVQNDGATTQLFGNNAVNTVADGLYHMGFEISRGRFLNEDCNKNASLNDVANWLNQLLHEDLRDGSLLASPVDTTLVGVPYGPAGGMDLVGI